MNTTALTRTCQQDPITAAALVGALEAAWAAIRARHADVPAAVIITCARVKDDYIPRRVGACLDCIPGGAR